MKLFKVWPDIGYAMAYELKPGYTHFFDFKIYNIAEEANGSILFYKNTEGSHTYVDNIEEADSFISGEIKWDGCSNFIFDEQKECMLHTCDRGSMIAIGEVLARTWDCGKDLLDGWDG